MTVVNGQPIRFEINQPDIFYGIMEVYVQQVYSYTIISPVNVVDIGVFMGDSALYFATNPFVNHVFGYELIPSTLEMAERNVALNPQLLSKITLFNFGLGNKEQSLEIAYISSQRGKSSIDGRDDKQKDLVETTKCNVKSALTELKKLPFDIPLVIKIDTEGAEYDILSNLDGSDVMKNTEAFMIEYHKGVLNLTDILNKNGFKCVSPASTYNSQVGMIYAMRIQG